jgi:hypothetical protein
MRTIESRFVAGYAARRRGSFIFAESLAKLVMHGLILS